MIYRPKSCILDVSLRAAEQGATFIFDQGVALIPRLTDFRALIGAPMNRPVYAWDAK
jgi:hypothetical protein